MILTRTVNPLLEPARLPQEPDRRGFHVRRAGLGVFAVQSIRDLAADPRFLEYQHWKQTINDSSTANKAGALAALIRAWQPHLPADWKITTPPAGASRPGPYPAAFLAAALAAELHLAYAPCLHRDPAGDDKTHHMALLALRQKPFHVAPLPAACLLVVDDFINTGTTLRLSLQALRDAGATCFGFAWGTCG